MSPFRDLSEHEINQLSDEEIIGYIRAAQRRRADAAATRALCILVYRHERFVMQLVRRKVKKHQVEEAFEVAMFAAIRAALRNPQIDNFKAWLRTIVDRRGIADLFRKHEKDPDFTPLAEENADDDQTWGTLLSVDSDVGYVGTMQIVESVLDELSPVHAAVIEIHVFRAYPAQETADLVNGRADADPGKPMSESNVNQIASRFRKTLRERLDESDTS